MAVADDEIRRLAGSRRGARRLRAVDMLEAASVPTAVPILTELLRDRWPRVADAAADALRERFGDPGHAALLSALDWDHEWGRLAAARSLAVAQEPRALAALDAALLGSDLDQWGPAVSRMVLFGDDARAIFERELLDEDGPPMLREMCAGALASAIGQDARPALATASRSSTGVVVRAARTALARLDREPEDALG